MEKTLKKETEINQNKEPKKRLIGLDIIRALAILFVFITHGITYKGILDTNVLSKEWSIFLVVRFIALCCVPLFIMLTGYLNNKKEISTKYYKGIIPLLISYFVISFIELFGMNMVSITDKAQIVSESKIVINDTVIQILPEKLHNIDWPVELTKIFNFTENSYAWYFEMYIGLFLLIPFLNILWDGLKSKKERLALVISLCFLSLVPKIFEGFKFECLNRDTLTGWLDVLPDYWKIVHPLAYFYIGKMIKEYQPHLKILLRLLLFIIAVSIPVLSCYFTSKSIGGYAWYMFNGFGTITNAFVALSVFLLFYDIKREIPVLSFLISQIAICSFDMYLFSSIFDKINYNALYTEKPLFFVVFMTLICTYICARIWITIRDLIFKKFIKLY